MSTKGDIKAAIPKGCINAILLRDLANVVGVDTRQVKRHIQDLRFEGEPIISKTDGGYYYPELGSAADMAKARRFVSMMRDQADQRYVTARVVEGWIENAEKEEKELQKMSKDILISAINAVERPLFVRYGFGWKGAEGKEMTKEELLGIVERGNYAYYTIKSEPDRWCINFHSLWDME